MINLFYIHSECELVVYIVTDDCMVCMQGYHIHNIKYSLQRERCKRMSNIQFVRMHAYCSIHGYEGKCFHYIYIYIYRYLRLPQLSYVMILFYVHITYIFATYTLNNMSVCCVCVYPFYNNGFVRDCSLEQSVSGNKIYIHNS